MDDESHVPPRNQQVPAQRPACPATGRAGADGTASTSGDDGPHATRDQDGEPLHPEVPLPRLDTDLAIPVQRKN